MHCLVDAYSLVNYDKAIASLQHLDGGRSRLRTDTSIWWRETRNRTHAKMFSAERPSLRVTGTMIENEREDTCPHHRLSAWEASLQTSSITAAGYC